jgi:hypothetical protein
MMFVTIRRLLLPAILLALCAPACVLADANSQVLQVLNSQDVYIAGHVYASGEAKHGDLKRLQAAVNAASDQGVAEKIALLDQFPRNIHGAADAASHIRNFEDFSGVVIVVWPHGIGLDSDLMTQGEENEVAGEAAPACRTSFTGCAIIAARAAVPKVQSEKNTAYRNAAIFWIVVLAGMAVATAAVVIYFRRRQLAILRESATPPAVADQSLPPPSPAKDQ